MLMLDLKLNVRFTKDSVRAESDLRLMDKARSSIVDMVGAYMGICEDAKYQILEFFKSHQIFKELNLRKSFLQNVLNNNQFALYKIEIAKYMKKNYGAYKIPIQEGEPTPERISFIAWVDCNIHPSSDWNKRLLVMSHRWFYILKDTSRDGCTMCGNEKFCPSGPPYVDHFNYQQIKSIIKFEGIE